MVRCYSYSALSLGHLVLSLCLFIFSPFFHFCFFHFFFSQTQFIAFDFGRHRIFTLRIVIIIRVLVHHLILSINTHFWWMQMFDPVRNWRLKLPNLFSFFFLLFNTFFFTWFQFLLFENYANSNVFIVNLLSDSFLALSSSSSSSSSNHLKMLASNIRVCIFECIRLNKSLVKV